MIKFEISSSYTENRQGDVDDIEEDSSQIEDQSNQFEGHKILP